MRPMVGAPASPKPPVTTPQAEGQHQQPGDDEHHRRPIAEEDVDVFPHDGEYLVHGRFSRRRNHRSPMDFRSRNESVAAFLISQAAAGQVEEDRFEGFGCSMSMERMCRPTVLARPTTTGSAAPASAALTTILVIDGPRRAGRRAAQQTAPPIHRRRQHRQEGRRPRWPRPAPRSLLRPGYSRGVSCSPTTSGQFGLRAHGNESPLVDDADAVGQLLGLLHVVSGIEDGHTAVAQLTHHVENAPAALRVDAHRRLVHEQQLRLVEQAGGDVDAPLHAAGEGACTLSLARSARPTWASTSSMRRASSLPRMS